MDKWQFSVIFYVDKILANPYIYYYLPQQFLYFFPLPHVQVIHIFMPFIIFMVFMVFIDFVGHNGISTNSIYGTNLYNCNLLSDDKWMTLSTFHLPRSFYHFLLFISNSTIFIIAQWVREFAYQFFIIILYFFILNKDCDNNDHISFYNSISYFEILLITDD